MCILLFLSRKTLGFESQARLLEPSWSLRLIIPEAFLHIFPIKAILSSVLHRTDPLTKEAWDFQQTQLFTEKKKSEASSSSHMKSEHSWLVCKEGR